MRRLLLDSNAGVSLLEGEANAPRVRAILVAASRLGVAVVVSPLTLPELLSKPGLSAREIARREDFCLSTEGIEFRSVSFDAEFARRVAGHRRRAYPQKMPDCMQYAFAEALKCDAILSNDVRLVRQSPVRAILVDDIEA